MDERVNPVGPTHQLRMANEEMLYLELKEEPKHLFDLDQLQSVFPRNFYAVFLESDRSKCSSELICLLRFIVCQLIIE